jgi:hypothetical protein
LDARHGDIFVSSRFACRRASSGPRRLHSSKARKAGRPGKAADVRKLVLELARDNPGWGYTRIRDAQRGLKIEVGRTTVANMLAQAGIEPAPGGDGFSDTTGWGNHLAGFDSACARQLRRPVRR